MTKEEQFEAFWAAYPRRIAKGTARKAFDKAIKKTTLADMLEAIAAYKIHKPEKIDFKHPSTWLNGECWCDEWAVSRPPFGGPPATSRADYIKAELARAERSWH